MLFQKPESPAQGRLLKNIRRMEFIPVVMAAGPGSRMHHLTNQCPKALLSIGNYPMVYYPVSILERAGYPEAILVVPTSYRDEILTTLVNVCGVKMRLDIVEVPELEEWGTAEILRRIRNRIPESSDVLVVGCDSITDLNLNTVINIFRKNNASVTMLLSTMKESQDLVIPGAKQKAAEKENQSKRDVFGISEDTGRVLLMKSKGDINKEEVFDPKIFQQHPSMRVRATLTDCHIYVMKRWILDYLAVHKDCEKMTSVKCDLLPHLVKKQFPSEKRLKNSRMTWKKTSPDADAALQTPKRLLPVSKDHDVYGFAEIYAALRINSKTSKMASSLTSGNGNSEDSDEEEATDPGLVVPQDNDVIRCYACVHDSGFCLRTNTLKAYCEANRQISKLIPTLVPQSKGLVHSSASLKKGAQVGPDCMVGDGAKVGEKVSVKKSLVGRNSVIHDKAKIANCIIMDQVSIGEGCTLMNSIVCTGATVSEMSELKDTIVTSSMNLPPLSKHTSEVVTDIERGLD